METKEIAAKLVEHCQNHTEAEGLNDLYADNATSTEAWPGPSGDPVSRGREAIAAKHQWWSDNFEVHGGGIEGPFVNGAQFTVVFEIDATDKSNGQRMNMKEVALYEVEDGKIARERFFMAPMPE